MKENIKLTTDLHNRLVDQFENRAKTLFLSGKKKIHAQAEFFVGAVACIDSMNNINGADTKESCCSPMIWVSIMRGELITKIEA